MSAHSRTRRRRRSHALPRRKTVRWSSAEVDGLLDGVREHGVGKWAAILRSSGAFNAVRTSVDLKDKWRNLAAHIRAMALGAADADAQPRPAVQPHEPPPFSKPYPPSALPLAPPAHRYQPLRPLAPLAPLPASPPKYAHLGTIHVISPRPLQFADAPGALDEVGVGMGPPPDLDYFAASAEFRASAPLDALPAMRVDQHPPPHSHPLRVVPHEAPPPPPQEPLNFDESVIHAQLSAPHDAFQELE